MIFDSSGTSRPTVPGSDYVCLDINKLMYDLEHDDETVVISSLLKWLPVKVLYNMRHAARCALRVVVVDKPSGSPLALYIISIKTCKFMFVLKIYKYYCVFCGVNMVYLWKNV